MRCTSEVHRFSSKHDNYVLDTILNISHFVNFSFIFWDKINNMLLFSVSSGLKKL